MTSINSISKTDKNINQTMADDLTGALDFVSGVNNLIQHDFKTYRVKNDDSFLNEMRKAGVV